MIENMTPTSRQTCSDSDLELKNVLSMNGLVHQTLKTPLFWSFQGLEIFGFAERGGPLD